MRQLCQAVTEFRLRFNKHGSRIRVYATLSMQEEYRNTHKQMAKWEINETVK